MSLDISLICKECGGICFKTNITHNFNEMAIAAKVCKCLWQVSKSNFKDAKQLVFPLQKAILSMEENSKKFKAFNPAWGDHYYYYYLSWLKELTAACEKYPNARIEISR